MLQSFSYTLNQETRRVYLVSTGKAIRKSLHDHYKIILNFTVEYCLLLFRIRFKIILQQIIHDNESSLKRIRDMIFIIRTT